MPSSLFLTDTFQSEEGNSRCPQGLTSAHETVGISHGSHPEFSVVPASDLGRTAQASLGHTGGGGSHPLWRRHSFGRSEGAKALRPTGPSVGQRSRACGALAGKVYGAGASDAGKAGDRTLDSLCGQVLVAPPGGRGPLSLLCTVRVRGAPGCHQPEPRPHPARRREPSEEPQCPEGHPLPPITAGCPRHVPRFGQVFLLLTGRM